MLNRSDFHYHLPPRQIAQQPPASRDGARLLVMGEQGLQHRQFADFASLLRADDLLVVNDTKVVRARLFGQKDTGGAAELLLERMLDEHTGLFQVRTSKPLQPGRRLTITGGPGQAPQHSNPAQSTVSGREGQFYRLIFEEPIAQVLDRLGSVPLPPYIQREPVHDDKRSYQTLFAQHAGAVAAPTAGLHFSESVLAQIERMGVQRVSVTLHVGAGTFSPMRGESLTDHRMHSERIEVNEAAVTAIGQCRARGGRVIAVGTTVVRTLESVFAQYQELRPFRGETQLFITPGFRFGVVDALLTNFHLPESTLLMLVCAFAGYDATMSAYREAVAEGYRFFSYGDAMFALRANA